MSMRFCEKGEGKPWRAGTHGGQPRTVCASGASGKAVIRRLARQTSPEGFTKEKSLTDFSIRLQIGCAGRI
ncbi:MAG: hypothetical protein QM617_03310 [Comamonas sp.]